MNNSLQHLLVCSLVIVLSLPAQTVEPAILTGTVTHVRDGDTIAVGSVLVRLNGVSAPELKKPLGPQSKEFLPRLVDGKSVRCELDGPKTYDHLVGTCYLEGKDISISAIEAGLALDCPPYSGGRYASYEINVVAAQVKLPKYYR
jgi:endonuclease YncB( thermonuclease family)